MILKLDPSEGLHEVEFGDDFTIEASFEATEDHSSDITAYCFVNGNEEDDISLGELDDGDSESFECDVDDGYFDREVDFEVELQDDADHFWVSDSYIYELDASPPVVDVFETTVQGIDVFNDDFEVEYLVSGDAGEVDQVEYYAGSDPGEGEGITYSDASGEFMVDTGLDDIEEGSNELMLRGMDSFERWGSSESLEFDYYPDKSPELDMSMDEELEVTEGETEDLQVDLSNTGDLLVESGELQASEMADSAEYSDIMPGESQEVELSFSSQDLGPHSVDIEASTVDVSQTVSVNVLADESTRNEIDNDFESIQESYQDLSEQVEDTRPGLSEEREDRLDSDFSEFDDSFRELEEAIASEEYYRADEILEGMDARQQSAMETFETVEEEQNVADRNRLIILFSMLLLGGLGTGAVYVAYNDEYEVSIPSVEEMPDFDEVKSSLQESLGSDSESTDSEDDGGYTSVADSEEADKEGGESLADKISSKINELTGSGEDSDEPKVEFK